MLRMFLTGDNHIGLKYASHEKATVLSQARIDAFDKMVQYANDEGCSLFVIAGDLFENTYSILKRDIKYLLDKLALFRGTVVVLPGNHDYYDKEVKVWQYFKEIMDTKDNILLITEYRPYTVAANGEEVVLYPAHCTTLHSSPGQNNLGWIKAAEIVPDHTYRIGLAHGALEGQTIDNEGLYFLMNRDELEEIPLDVWLIGHTHVPFPDNLNISSYTEGERIFNAGTHVQTDYNCNTEGLSFVIEISEDKTVRAKKVVTGNLNFYRKNLTLNAGHMVDSLESVLSAIPDRSVVDLVLSGAVMADEYDDRSEVLDSLLARFIEGSYSDYGLSKLISQELIDAEFPETSFSSKFLSALIDDPKEAQLAYELLQTLKEGR